MKKIILEFDFLSGPIYKDVYDIKNNEIITGIDELDNNEKIKSINQEMQDIYLLNVKLHEGHLVKLFEGV